MIRRKWTNTINKSNLIEKKDDSDLVEKLVSQSTMIDNR